MKSAVAARDPGAQQDGARASDAANELLEELFRGWVFAACPAFFHPDLSQHVGFVSALVRNKTVYVPIHLAPIFPTHATLEELVDRAEEVRTMTDSTVCLSGSRVFGVSSTVDTDYCEYVLDTGLRLAGSFIKLDSLRSSICVAVRHSDYKLVASEVLEKIISICHTDSGFIGAGCTCKPRDWKFDYFCLTPTAPIIVTNLCVHDKDCEDFSWAYQEAAITAAGQPLRQLVDSLQLGRYVHWLRNVIEDYRLAEPLKGLKRALALCTILALTELSSSLLVLLNSPVAVQLAKNVAERDAAKLREHLPPQEQSKVSAPALESGETISEDRFRTEANSILNSVIEHYDIVMQRAKGMIDAQCNRS